MKIKLTESKLKQIVAESVKNVLTEIDALNALEYGRKAYSQGTPLSHNWSPDNKEYNERKKKQGENIKKMAIDKMNAEGSGKCIQQASPWQINFVSGSGHEVYVTADGKWGILGDQGRNSIAIPNELKVRPEDAKLIANWCNKYLKNEYALKYWGNEQYWVAK